MLSVLRPHFWAVPDIVVCAPKRAVHVWAGHLQSSSFLLHSFLQILSPEENERFARFCFEKDRRSHVFARGIVRVVLGRYLRQRPQDVHFQYSSFGKPLLSGGPGTLHFNVSHSGELVLVAVASGEVGVDLELLRPISDSEGIVKRFFSTREAEEFMRLPADQKERAFFACWTRKEAFVKALGKGLSLALHDFDVTVAPDLPPKLEIPSSPEEALRWRFHDLPPINGFAAALVTAAPVEVMECWRFEG